MQQYVVGFLFSEDGKEVLLIRKTKPSWQAGRLNGVGGKVETGETPAEAMRREMKEEADLDIADWEHYAILEGEGRYQVHMFRAQANGRPAPQSLTEEVVSWEKFRPLPEHAIGNLSWLIPLALDRDLKVPVRAIDKGEN